MDLPYPEDIYDFGEEELNTWKHRVTEALSVYVPGSNDKWERKALRVQDLIQTELDERISISQISQFCLKELNSKLYQELQSESPASTPTTTPIDPTETLRTEDSVSSSSQGPWLNRSKMNKKEYQDFIRQKLKSTQVSAGVVIGSSTVAQTKTHSARTKSAERTTIQPEKTKKTDINHHFKPEKSQIATQKSLKTTSEEVKKPVTGKKTVPNSTSVVKKTVESRVSVTNLSPGVGNKRSTPRNDKEITGEKRVIKPAHAGKDVERSETGTKRKKEEIETVERQEKGKKTEEIGIKIEKSGKNVEENELILEKVDEIAPKAEKIDTEIEENRLILKEMTGKITQIAKIDPKPEENPLTSKEKIDPGLETGYQSDSEVPPPLLSTPSLSTEPSSIPVSEELEVQKATTESEESENEEEPGTVTTEMTVTGGNTMVMRIHSDEEPVSMYVPSVVPEEVKSALVIAEEDTEEENDDGSQEPTINFSIGKSVVTSDSQLPPVTLKPKPAPIPQDVFNRVETARSEVQSTSSESGPSARDTKTTEIEKKTVTSSEAAPQIRPISTKSTVSLDTKPGKTTARPPRPKPPVRTKPANPIKPPTTPAQDFSDIYRTISDLFNGGNTKEFDLISSVRNSLSMFHDLEEQMAAPDFEFQRSFKFALAPLEMDPREFVRTGGRLEMDSSLVKPPTDKEMYYRVVRARQEVYDIVTRSFLKKSGWTELPHGMSLRCSWNIMWTWSKPRVDFTKLLVWQRVNHFPNSKQFSRKDYLKRNIERVAKLNVKCAQAWNITPPTFLLPKEYIQFCDEFAKYSEEDGNYWIMKPVGKSRGRGISVVKDITEVAYSEPMVIQRYLKHPLLLGGFKFDLRIYVLITALNPLEAFLYKEGFARMSTLPYSLHPDKITNKFIHLTNSSIQKHNHCVQTDSLDHSFGGTKISLDTLRQRLKYQGVDFECIWAQIREIIVKSLLAVQTEMESTPSSFDLVGYDVIIDANLKVWLIEINSSPSLARDNLLDDMVKQTLIDDTLDLINPIPFSRKKLIKVLERRVGELQKGNIGSISQLHADVTEIMDGWRPRRYGEMPEKVGNFERVAPSPLLDQYQKLLKVS